MRNNRFARLVPLLLTCLLATSLYAAGERPNIVVIMVDDLDNHLFNSLLAANKIPNIDKYFVNQGMNFTNHFVSNPVCCPSRASYLTGQYSHNHGILSALGPRKSSYGISFWLNSDKHEECNTLTTWLQKGGYCTGHVGKYLNGYGWDTSRSYVPPGYNYWFGLLDVSTYRMYRYKVNENGKFKTYGNTVDDYQTDVIAAKAQGFIRRRAHKDQPFYLFVAPTAPHIEHKRMRERPDSGSPFEKTITPPQRYMQLRNSCEFRRQVLPPTTRANFNEADVSEKPCWVRTKPRLAARDKRDVENQFYDRALAFMAVDDLVGSVMSALIHSEKWGNTIVVLTSDNGWFHGEHRLSQKSLAYEESIHVPFLVTGPGVRRGSRCDKMIANIDVPVTIAELAQVHPRRRVDGMSFAGNLVDPQAACCGREHVLIEGFQVQARTSILNPPGYRAVRRVSEQNNDILVQWLDGSRRKITFTEYYDLRFDPFQLQSTQLHDGAFWFELSELESCHQYGDLTRRHVRDRLPLGLIKSIRTYLEGLTMPRGK